MAPPWLTLVSWIAIFVGVLSALALVGDIWLGRRRQRMAIMNLVWPITGLYFGPVALWAYARWARAPRQNEAHDAGHGKHGERPLWQAGLIGVSHCGAGCTVGDVVGELLVFTLGILFFGSHLVTVYVVDFTLAFIAGIVFQYFAIAPMRGLGLGEGIVAALKADTLSLAAFEVGMFAWMALSSEVLFHPRLEPNQPAFWFMMQVAMLLGFATSYPANLWLIERGLKERM